jgi:hypothetical protein
MCHVLSCSCTEHAHTLQVCCVCKPVFCADACYLRHALRHQVRSWWYVEVSRAQSPSSYGTDLQGPATVGWLKSLMPAFTLCFYAMLVLLWLAGFRWGGLA